MSPEQIAKANTEHAHQTALFAWAASFPELRWMFAIPNGGSRDKITAGNLKAEGVKAGVSDIFLPVARGLYHGLFIEMKVGKNVPSPFQIHFMDVATDNGYRCALCYSWMEARDAIVEYMRGSK